jgi:hypothetical protein
MLAAIRRASSRVSSFIAMRLAAGFLEHFVGRNRVGRRARGELRGVRREDF